MFSALMYFDSIRSVPRDLNGLHKISGKPKLDYK